MAKTVKSTPRPTALQEALRIEKSMKKRELLPRLIVLEGEESYYIDRIEKAIVENYIDPECQATDRIIFYGLDATFDQLNEYTKGASLFATKQLVVLREAQLMADLNKLINIAVGINTTTTLLVIYRGSMENGKKKLLTALMALPQEEVCIISSPKIKSNRDILSIVTQSAKAHNCTIDEPAKELLIYKLGFNGSLIDNEIGKLALAAGTLPITSKLVDALVGFSREFSMKDFYNAVTKLQRKEAFMIGKVMAEDEKNYPLPLIVATLWNFFANMLAVYYIRSDLRSPDNIAQTLGLKNKYAVDEYLTAINRFQPKHIVEIIHALRMTDARFKGADNGDYHGDSLLMNLLYTIFH